MTAELKKIKIGPSRIREYTACIHEYSCLLVPRILKTVPPGSKVLEIGAGMGENTVCLLDLGFDVRSTDISVESVKSVEYLKYRFANTIFFRLNLLIWSNCHLMKIRLTWSTVQAA